MTVEEKENLKKKIETFTTQQKQLESQYNQLEGAKTVCQDLLKAAEVEEQTEKASEASA